MVAVLYGRNKVKIEIKSCHIPTLKFLLESEKPDGIIVQLVPPRLQTDTSIDWTTVIVSLAASVPVNIFTDWLSKKLLTNDRNTKISVNRKEIYFDKGEVTRLIEEAKIIEHGKIDEK